jgi:surface antigen
LPSCCQSPSQPKGSLLSCTQWAALATNAAVIIRGKEVGVGDDAVRENIDIGKVVIVEGRRVGEAGTLVADRVIYSSSVQGPVASVQSIDPSLKQVMVLGQKVILNVVTLFRDTTFDGLAPNDIVEISGFLDDTGAIWATFVGKTGVFVPGLEAEVKGFVNNLDADLKTFQINGLIVNYASADTSRLPDGTLSNGLLVEVIGILDAVGAEMSATEIGPGDEVGVADANEIEVTGFVTALFSLSEFTVGNQRVKSDVGTLFVDGTQADVALGAKIEVSGILSNGVLYATEIEFWQPDQIEFEDPVAAIASANEFTVGSQLVRTDSGTVFEGGTPEDIVVGVLLEIKGVPVDTARSIVVADKVSFENE